MAEYVITIRNESGGGTSDSPTATPTGGGAAGQQGEGLKEPTTRENLANMVKKVKGMAAVGFAVSVADSCISYEVNTVELRTGSRGLQERISWQYEIGKKSFSALSSLAMGALIGGPAGLAAAGVGVAMSAAMTAIGYAQNQQTINIKKSLESETIALNYIRAGAGGDRIGRVQ